MDKIQLKGMVFYGFHGVGQPERDLGQRFIVDLEMERDLNLAGLTDNPEDTVNYSRVYTVVKDILEGPSRKLLENLAETIAQKVFSEFKINSIKVIVKKPEVPIKGSILAYASVQIERSKKEIK